MKGEPERLALVSDELNLPGELHEPGELDEPGEPDLQHAELTIEGRITVASNATFVGGIGDVRVVYKPIAGERPLWDFPDGNLASREVAAFAVSEAMGWRIVPPTWLREGPLGRGMVQRWQEPDAEQDPVNIVPSEAVPGQGWRTVLEGSDESGRALAVIHEDSAALRRIAVFDVLVNNADRKGSHILPVADHRFGVDHGVTFHLEPKLRTVLWGWVGESLDSGEIAGVERVMSGLRGDLGEQLATLLSGPEIEALAARCERLRTTGSFPRPDGDAPAVPWPLF